MIHVFKNSLKITVVLKFIYSSSIINKRNIISFVSYRFYYFLWGVVLSIRHSPKCKKVNNVLQNQNCQVVTSNIMPFTLSEPGYDIFVPWNRLKTSSCQLLYQHHSSSADCARVLFNGSDESASLLVCTQKIFLVGGCRSFVSDVVSKVVFNTLRAGLIQAVRKKQLIRTWLCGWISPLLFALATRRISQKTWPV